MKSSSLYKIFGATVLTSGLLFGGLSYANSDASSNDRKCHDKQEQRGWFGKHKGHHGGPLAEVKRLMKKLDLSDDQREEVRTIIQNAKPEFKENMMAMRDNQHQLHSQIKTDHFDQADVEATANAQAELTKEIVILSAQVHSDIFQILTPEQRDKVQKVIEKKREHHKK